MPGEARRHLMGMIAAGAMLALLVLAMVNAITVAADGQPAGETPDANTNTKANRDVREGLDATRYAQPPPLTPPPGILGDYYPFHTASRILTTPPPVPTPPPFSGTQSDNNSIRDR